MYSLDYEADITVIGGSAVGLTTAYALARAGLRVCVLDRHGPGQPHPQRPPEPISDIAIRFLASLGLDYSLSTSERIKSYLFKDRNGEVLLDLPLSDHQLEAHQQVMISSHELREAMSERIKGNARITLRAGHAAHELQLDEEWVFVIGETYDQRQFYVRSLFVIDCDNELSLVNQVINAPVKALRRPRTWLSVLLETPNPSMRCSVSYYQNRPLIRVPLGSSYQRWTLGAIGSDQRELLSSKEFIVRFLDEVAGVKPSAIRGVSLQDYPMTIREKLWEHRTALIGEPSIHFSDDQAWLGDSALDTGLGDAAALIWPLTGIFTRGLTINALKVWEQKRLSHRTTRAERHRKASDMLFKQGKSAALSKMAEATNRVSKFLPIKGRKRTGIVGPSQADLRRLVTEPNFLRAGPLLFNAGNTGMPIPTARIIAALDANGQIVPDMESFNAYPIQSGRLDKVLPPGYVIMTLGYDPEQILPQEAVEFWRALDVTMLRINPQSIGARPKSVCDADGRLAEWIRFGQPQNRQDYSMVLVTPERYCAALFSPAQSFALIELFCRAYGLNVPDFVGDTPKISVVPLVDEPEDDKPSIWKRIRSYAEKHAPSQLSRKSSSEPSALQTEDRKVEKDL